MLLKEEKGGTEYRFKKESNRQMLLGATKKQEKRRSLTRTMYRKTTLKGKENTFPRLEMWGRRSDGGG